MVNALIFILVAFISYFIGTINFSKIIAWYGRHKDITKLGSGNPGTMNMLRNFGFGLALATFIAEVVKAGLCCLAFKLIYPEFGQGIYFFSGLFLMLGYNFPVWSKFKGGKGVATFAGIFLFSNLWYVALAWFAVCFVLLIIIDYGSVISFIYIGGLTIAYTIYVWVEGVYLAWAITAIIWFLLALTIFKVVTDPEQKNFIRKIVSQIAAAIIVFFLPTLVNLIMMWVPDGGGSFNISSCWQAAREAKGEISMILPVEEISK